MNKIKKAVKFTGLYALSAFALVWNLPRIIKRNLFDGKPVSKSIRAIACALAVIMIATMIPLSGIVANAAGEDSTKDIVLNGDTYEIYTAKGLSDFRDKVNGGELTINAKLMDNIDLSTVCGADVGGAKVNWTPIGTSSNRYNGTFDGNGKKINNLYFDNNEGSKIGFFSVIGADGIVKNLELSGEINCRSTTGGITAYNYGLIEKCTFNGSLKAIVGYVGGIVSFNLGTVKKCINNATITNTYESKRVGGIVSYNTNSKNIKTIECVNNGNIIAENTENVGGIAGYIESNSTVKDCYNTGNVVGQNNVGGVIGNLTTGILENSYNVGNITGTTNVGGSVGHFETSFSNNKITNSYYLDTSVTSENTIDGITAKTADEMKSAEFLTALNATDKAFFSDAMNINNGYPVLNFQIFNFEGDGTVEAPYLIYTAEELEYFAQLVNGVKNDINAKLMNDIDLSTVCGANVGGAEVSWTPIGNSTNIYNGTFDGGGHTVDNLYINGDVKYQALFGYTDETATIKDLNVNGNITGNEELAGIVYRNEGVITNCSFSGTVTGGRFLGGVVFQNTNKITKCTNNATITATATEANTKKIGGIAGFLSQSEYLDCYVSECVNNGKIVAENGQQVGGVVGYDKDYDAIISNCYNTAAVTGNDKVGGIVGDLSEGSVQNCYNTGTVTATITAIKNIGGVVGYLNLTVGNEFVPTITNCYYLADSETDSYDGTTAKIAAQFASGEVAKLLGDAFGQMITGDKKDNYPVFRTEDNSNQVLSVGFKVIGADVTDTVFTNPGKVATIPDTYSSYTNMKDQNKVDFTSATLVTEDLVITAIPQPTYTVTIPATLDFGDVQRRLEKSGDRYKKVEDLTVSAQTSYLFANNKKLSVTLSSDFTLSSGENELAYEVYDEKDALLKTDSTVLDLNYTEYDTDKISTAKFYATLDQSQIRVGGKYTGTLTFTVALDDIT